MNNSVDMSLEINEMVFKSILDNLYTNLPLAVVREICCNAMDSHIVARNYSPFFVQKPTVENPFFIVRDFGTGLSKEDVFKYLNTLLSSNKKTQIDLTGQYGLGSKAVLAFNEEYRVISYFQGMCYEFLFKRINKGIPTLTLLSEISTSEPNGIKYIVSLEENQINTFCKRLDILDFFRIPPRIFEDIEDLTTEIDRSEHRKEIALSDVFYVKPRPSYDFYSFNRVMPNYNVRLGDIVYPALKMDHLNTEEHNLLSDIFKTSCFIINLDPVLLDLPLNRESLIDNQSNKEIIQENLQSCVTSFCQSILTEFNSLYGFNYTSVLSLRTTCTIEHALKFSRFISDKFNTDSFSIINMLGPYGSERLPENLQDYSFHYNTLASISNRSQRISFYPHIAFNSKNTKVILTHITNKVTAVKLSNFQSRNNSDYAIVPIHTTIPLQEIDQNIIDFFLFIIKGYKDKEVEYWTSSEMNDVLVAENRLRLKQNRLNNVSTTPSSLTGIRVIPSLFNCFRKTGNAIYNNSENIISKIDIDNKVIPFDSSYFPNDSKYLVVSKTTPGLGSYKPLHSRSIYVFDKIIITTDKLLPIVVHNLKLKEDNLVLTLDTLGEYPLVPNEDKEEMIMLNKKDVIRDEFYRLFDPSNESFNDFQISLTEHLSTSTDSYESLIFEVLSDLHTPNLNYLNSWIVAKETEVGRSEIYKYNECRFQIKYSINLFEHLKPLLARDFLLENKDKFLNSTNNVILLKHYIEVTT